MPAKNKHKDLSEKQRKFCEQYLVDLNATQAAIRAGYSAKTANRIASSLLSKVDIQNEIQNLKKQRSKRTEITADRVLKELAKIGFANIEDYAKVDDYEIEVGKNKKGEVLKRTIRSVEIFKTSDIGRKKLGAVAKIKQGRSGIEIELYDKLSALDKIARHLGMYEVKKDDDDPDDIKKAELAATFAAMVHATAPGDVPSGADKDAQ